MIDIFNESVKIDKFPDILKKNVERVNKNTYMINSPITEQDFARTGFRHTACVAKYE